MEKLVCSFSGGKTSAYMAIRLKQEVKDKEVVYIFANTGQENEETLKFVDAVDKAYSLGVVWVEAVVSPVLGEATGFRRVSYESACRDGSIFAEVCAKYGIPNSAFPHCTRELKLAPITAYLKHIGWGKGDYLTAIGIREDESRRAGKAGCVYPLIDWWPTDKQDINSFWEDQPFTLQLKAQVVALEQELVRVRSELVLAKAREWEFHRESGKAREMD